MKSGKEEIKKYNFKESLKLGFEIIDLQKILKSKGDLMTVSHRAQFYHILWIEKGKGCHFVDFNTIDIEDNCVVFLPHNCVNKFDNNGHYEGKVILFTNSFFCKNNEDRQFLFSSILFSDLYPTAKFKVSPHDCNLKVLLNEMEAEFKGTPDSAQYQILRNMLHIFLLQAEREMRKLGLLELKPSSNLECLITFKELLELNFHKDKSVSKYAADLNITEKILNKATTSLLDKTPKQLIDERIILEAKRLLVHSNQTIKEIAYYLGYEEPTNFIKYFKKHCNITPSEFREQN